MLFDLRLGGKPFHQCADACMGLLHATVQFGVFGAKADGILSQLGIFASQGDSQFGELTDFLGELAEI